MKRYNLLLILACLFLSLTQSFSDDMDALLEDALADEIKTAKTDAEKEEGDLQRHSIFFEPEISPDTDKYKIQKKYEHFPTHTVVHQFECCGEQYALISKNSVLKYSCNASVASEYRLWVRYSKPFNTNNKFNIEIQQPSKIVFSEHFGDFTVEKSEGIETLNKEHKLFFDRETYSGTGFVTKGFNDFLWEYRDVKLSTGPFEVTISSGENDVGIDCVYLTKNKKYNPRYDDMQKIWVRWKLNYPDDVDYYVGIGGNNHAYPTWYFSLGNAGRNGLTKDAVKETDYLKSAEWSPWVKMPDISPTHTRKWDAGFGFAGFAMEDTISADFEFSLLPGGGDIYNVAKDEISANNSVRVIMPIASKNAEEKKRETWTHNQYLERRLAHTADIDTGIPMLKKIAVIGQFGIINPVPGLKEKELVTMYRTGVTLPGYNVDQKDDTQVKEYCDYINKIGFPIAGDMIHWSAATAHVPLNPNDDYYAGLYRGIFAHFSKAKRPGANMKLKPGVRELFILNLGDEIGAAIDAEGIRKNNFYLQEFRKYLEDRNFSPEFFGEETWRTVFPKASLSYEENLFSPSARRLFFQTQEYISHFTTTHYRAFTDGIRNGYGKEYLVCANYQANPMQSQWMWRGAPDIFELGRQKGFSLQWMEDWTGGTERGILGILFGVNLLRSSCQKQNLSYGGYLVADCGNAEERFYAWAGWGAKYINLYCYGPVYSYMGHTWEDDPNFMREINRATRDFAKAEDIIYNGRIRKSKVALLYGKTDEVWGDIGFVEERKCLFAALLHENISFDLIEEGDIVEDDKQNNYEVIYAGCGMIKETAQKKLKEWVKNGGTLIGIVGAGTHNEYNENTDILDEAFGMSGRFQSSASETVTVLNNTGLPEVSFNTIGATTRVILNNGTPLALFGDRSPAIIYNRFGKGYAYFYCFFPGRQYFAKRYKDIPWEWAPADDRGNEYRQLIVAPAENINDIRPFEVAPKGVVANLFEHDTGVAVVMVSRLYDPVKNGHAVIDNFTVIVHNVKNVKSVTTARGQKVEYTIVGTDLTVKFQLIDRDILIIRKTPFYSPFLKGDTGGFLVK